MDQGEEAQERGWLGEPGDMDAYYAEQRASLRAGTFARLHLNHWQAGEEAFVTAEKFDACVAPDLVPPPADKRVSVFVGADAATRRDCAAVVAVAAVGGEGGVSFRVVRHRIWTQQRGQTLDLEETVEAYLLQLSREFRLREVRYDPYQMVRSAQALGKQGVQMTPYDQTSGNLTLAGQTLYDLVNGRQIQFYPDAELRRHFLNAVAVHSGRGWRLAKEKTSNKIDGCVAASFAALAAVEGSAMSPGDAWMEAARRMVEADGVVGPHAVTDPRLAHLPKLHGPDAEGEAVRVCKCSSRRLWKEPNGRTYCTNCNAEVIGAPAPVERPSSSIVAPAAVVKAAWTACVCKRPRVTEGADGRLFCGNYGCNGEILPRVA